MSYVKPKTGDGVNDFFTNIGNFVNIAPNLLKYKNKRAFMAWFDKLYEIDKRSLVLYLREHKNEINPDYIKLQRNDCSQIYKSYPCFPLLQIIFTTKTLYPSLPDKVSSLKEIKHMIKESQIDNSPMGDTLKELSEELNKIGFINQPLLNKLLNKMAPQTHLSAERYLFQ